MSDTARHANTGFSRTKYHFKVLVEAGLITPRFWRPIRGVRETFYVHVSEAVSHPMASGMLDATVLWPEFESWQPEGNEVPHLSRTE